MYHFKYVSKNAVASKKKEIIELLNLVQDNLRDSFTFQYKFVGSTERNMITWDVKSNIGFDFAIVNDYGDNRQEYIRFNKKNNSYTWEENNKGFYLLPEKVKFCKNNGLWQEVRERYLYKKIIIWTNIKNLDRFFTKQYTKYVNKMDIFNG